LRWIFVDKLIECDPGRRVVGVKTFPRSDLMFLDHFPGLPRVPGVLQLEMIAQAAGKCVRLARPGVRTLLGAVRSAKFIRPVEPGDRCRITVEIVKLREQFAIACGTIDVDGIKASTAELLMAIVPEIHPEPSGQDPIVEEWKQSQGVTREHDPLDERVAAVAD
jgi:3-hydroxyacyl-[acyl-carrier-protein] dehydratase